MPIDFRCTHCSKRLRVPDGSIGKKAQCPHCQGVIALTQQVADAGLDGLDPAANAPSMAASSNPYQAPSIPADLGLAAMASTREDVLAKVKLPAIGMIVHAVLTFLLTLFSIGVSVATGARGIGAPPPATETQATIQIVWAVVSNLLSLVMSVIIFVGARRMMRIESRGWSLTAAIISAIPCCGCCLVGMPVGIWAISVLNEKDVKAWFLLAKQPTDPLESPRS